MKYSDTTKAEVLLLLFPKLYPTALHIVDSQQVFVK